MLGRVATSHRTMTPLEATAAWSDVLAHAPRLRDTHLRKLFADDAGRGTRFRADACGLTLDYAKQRIDAPALRSLLALAQARCSVWLIACTRSARACAAANGAARAARRSATW
jgi:hypothetical protein